MKEVNDNRDKNHLFGADQLHNIVTTSFSMHTHTNMLIILHTSHEKLDSISERNHSGSFKT